MMLGILFGLFFLLLFIGMPVAYGMVISAVVTLFFDPSLTGIIIPQKLFTGMDSFSLMAVPFFMLAGTLMEKSGITDILVNWAKSLVGHFKGGLGHATIVTGVVMAGVSGSANADTSALASILVPIMHKDGYDDGYSCALVSSCGALGPVIPPSIMMVLYSGVTSIAIGKLFMAGIIPGLVIAIGYMIVNGVYARKAGIPKSKFVGWKALGQDTLKALPALIMPVIIIGGILSGATTATEAGVVACVYGILYGIITKNLTLKGFLQGLADSCVAAVGPMMIITYSSIFSYMLTRMNVANMISNFCVANITSEWVFLLFVLIVTTIACCFIDGMATMLMLLPVLTPVVTIMNIDFQHFALVYVMGLLTCQITPPVGNLIYVAASIQKTPVKKVVKSIIPFCVVMILVIFLCIFVPELVTWLPNLIYG